MRKRSAEINKDNSHSCLGCVFLYTQDEGYSSYTITDTLVFCAQRANPNIIDGASAPYDWIEQGFDQWPATMRSRCSLYANVGESVHFDVDDDSGSAVAQLPSHPFFGEVIDKHREGT